VFGERGEGAVASDLRQLHVRDVLDPRRPWELFTQERASALAYFIFLKEKRSGEVKGWVALMAGHRETTSLKKKKVRYLSQP